MPSPELIDLITHPVQTGQYEDGKPYFKPALPVKGLAPHALHLGHKTILEVEDEMELRRIVFTEQQSVLVNPPTWVQAGYVSDATGVTAYYFIVPPNYVYAPTYWSNWPTEPAVWSPVP